MPYIVFARKYRPQSFDEVVGQEHITTTLKNAIKLDRVAHAYLFAGPRGVGKTTTARILAKALNCEKGPTSTPCNRCVPCLEITRGSSLDILEIDGASNRGVDEVRNLRDNVKFSPSKGRFKVYIIDEVHMLTPDAFNALLKTLEEPPPHVKFIFATTRPHKVLPTVISRCQRFDFRMIPRARIMECLKGIAKKEDIKASDDALELIAKYADGSMRDAEVILDQIASNSSGKVGTEDVISMLGVIDEDSLFALTEFIAKKDTLPALKALGTLIDSGKDPSQLLTGLIEHFRNVLVARISKDPAGLIDASPEKRARFGKAAALFSVEEILYSIYALSGAADLARKTSLSRVPLEITIVKLCERSRVMSLDKILKKVKELEAALAARKEEAPRRVSAPSSPPPKGPEPAPNAGSADKMSPSAGTPEGPSASAPDAGISDISNSWQSVLNTLRGKKMSVASYLLEGQPSKVDGRTLVIDFPREFQFHKEVLEDNPENKFLIEEALKEVFSVDYRVKFELVGDAGLPAAGSRMERPYGGQNGKGPAAANGRNARKIDPVVEDALNVFDGEVVGRDNVQPKGKGPK